MITLPCFLRATTRPISGMVHDSNDKIDIIRFLILRHALYINPCVYTYVPGSMLELLRLYEETNPFHKIDYSMDDVYMELEDDEVKFEDDQLTTSTCIVPYRGSQERS